MTFLPPSLGKAVWAVLEWWDFHALGKGFHMERYCQDHRDLVAVMYQERDGLKSRIAELERERDEVYRKLDEGTLHVTYCNGDHSKRVGSPDTICNCTLGREIKSLRSERDALKEANERMMADLL